MQAGVITVSDRASRGEREDLSGAVVCDILRGCGAAVEVYQIIPDDPEAISEAIVDLVDEVGLNLIVTTGGTGLGPRDFTPEATLRVVHRLVPGMAERMRAVSMEHTPHAMLSRAVVGIRGTTLILNLPGSPKACRECLEAVIPALGHAIELLRGDVADCGVERD